MVLVFLLDYYWLGYLAFMLLVLIFGITVAPVVAYIIVLIMLITFWINNFRVKEGTIPGKVISVFGVISAFFIASSLSDSALSLKCSFVILGSMSIFLLLQKWEVLKKIVPYLHIYGSAVCLFFSVSWTIGYEMDTNTKFFYENIAYYQCNELEVYHTDSRSYEKSLNNEKPLNGVIYDITDINIMGITDDHILGTYAENDILKPDLQENAIAYSNMWDSYDDITWYPVITDKGEKGFVPSTGLRIIYYGESEYVDGKAKSFKPTTWYSFLPDAVIHFCERLYELIPLCARQYLT